MSDDKLAGVEVHEDDLIFATRRLPRLVEFFAGRTLTELRQDLYWLIRYVLQRQDGEAHR
jgi:hypothetical protein